MKDNSDIDYKRRTHYIIIALLGIAVLWLNYCSLRAHVSSNSRLITDYQPKEDELARYRNPAVAGIFYSADKDRLDSEVEHYLADTASPLDYQPRILIVPHAGYVYSASTAAKAYGRLQKYAAKIKNVILLGPSHRVAFRGAALPSADFFATPLGAVPVNRELTAQLAALPGFKIDDHPHKEEHSLEVQLPFLQKVLKKFKIIPVVYGEVDPGLLAQALEPLVERDDTLLVVSADLSHYNDYETARELDGASGRSRFPPSPCAPRRTAGGKGCISYLVNIEVRAQVPCHPVAAAEAGIPVVGPQHHLLALLHHPALSVKPCVEGGLFAAPADGLDLLQLVRHSQQIIAALEQLAPEVCLQAVAQHGDAAVVHQVDQVNYLILGEKLGLVNNDAGVFLQFLIGPGPHFVKIHTGMGQADAGGNHVISVPGVQAGLHHQGLLAPLLVIEPRHQSVGGFAGAHGPIFEIKLRHRHP